MTVFKKRGKWVAQVYDPALGRARQVGTFTSQREARAAERAAEEQKAAADAGVTAKSMTVARWRERWLEGYDRESTRSHNTERTARFAEEYGDRLLTDITPGMAQRWGQQHPSTVSALSAMLSRATKTVGDDDLRLLQDNPFAGMVPRKVYKRDLRDEWLTDDDVTELERCAGRTLGAYGQDAAAIIRFAAETGIRPGELFTLEEADMDIARGELIVRRAADSKTHTIGPPKGGTLDEPKARTIVLSKRAAAGGATRC